MKLTGELRKNFDEFKSGIITKAEYEEKDKKISADILAMGKRLDEMEIKANRPLVPTGGDGKVLKPGQAEYKASFFNFLRTGDLKLEEKAKAFIMERKALVEDTTGQILVPEEIETEIYRTLPKLNILRGLCMVRNTVRDRIMRRSLTEVAMAWGKLELGKVPAETDVVPGEAWQHVEDLNGLAKIGKDELQDSDVALEAIISDSFARARADSEETAIMVGTGHSHEQPEGILNGSVVARVLTTAPDAIAIDDTLDLAYAVLAQYRRNGTYLFASTTELALRKLKSAVDGHYYWQPSVQAGKPATLNGFPIETQDDIPAIGSSTSCDIGVFGDFRAGYRIIDRQGMTMQRLLELFSLAGLIGLLAGYRVGGGVIRAAALRVLREHS